MIEGVLLEHPDIIDAAVAGIYDPSKELQLVRGYVVKNSNAELSEEDVCEWVRKGSRWRPRHSEEMSVLL